MKSWNLRCIALLAWILAGHLSLFAQPAADKPPLNTLGLETDLRDPSAQPLSLPTLPLPGAETAYESETRYAPTARPLPEVPRPVERPIVGEAVEATTAGLTLRGYLTRPSSPPFNGGLLLLPEFWGVNEATRQRADDFARYGYRVLVLDFYDGQPVASRGDAARLMRELDRELTQRRIGAAAQWLSSTSGVRDLPVAIIGYGLGATLGLHAMTQPDPTPPAVRGLVLFYGETIAEPGRLETLGIPIVGFYATEDFWVRPEKVAAFDDALTSAGVPHQFFHFDTQTGFGLEPADYRQQGYHHAANDRILDFLARYLH
ncbi:MAG TPA: dienelactone hydrolase family protein [Candidatus Sumerlaeota bacterium]|nr:dienelactone hydrolase family protein [Candidatus Sumerlaeota bacterium]